MMLDKKQILAVSLFEFKMVHKAVETNSQHQQCIWTGNCNERTVRWWFKEFWKGHKSLKMSAVAGRGKSTVVS